MQLTPMNTIELEYPIHLYMRNLLRGWRLLIMIEEARSELLGA
jgi:hypothetical protein